MLFRESTIQNQVNHSFHVREWIPEEQPVGLLFLLHGLSDHGGRFKFLGESFAGKGFVFFATDLRGNGLSYGKRGHFDSYEQVMDDISYLLDQARKKFPDIPVIIYGQSMGGNLALNYCIRRQPLISGVIASSPWLRLVRAPSAITKLIGSIVGAFFPALSVSNGLNADELTHDAVLSQAYRDDPLIHGRITLNTFKVISESGEWAIRHAGNLKLPLLLLHGTGDRITSYEASRQFEASCKTEHVFLSKPGLYHELHNEPSKQELFAEIMDWVNNSIK